MSRPQKISPDQMKIFFQTLVVIFSEHHLQRKNMSRPQKISPDQMKIFFRALIVIFS